MISFEKYVKNSELFLSFVYWAIKKLNFTNARSYNGIKTYYAVFGERVYELRIVDSKLFLIVDGWESTALINGEVIKELCGLLGYVRKT
jgi:hypothetical protein